MKNINYDLIKLLHIKLDEIHRLEKFYIADATEAKCHSLTLLDIMLKDAKEKRDALIKEIKMRLDAEVFT